MKKIYVIALYNSRDKKYKPFIERDINSWSSLGLVAYARTFFLDKKSAIKEAKRYGPPCKSKVFTYTLTARSKNLEQKFINLNR